MPEKSRSPLGVAILAGVVNLAFLVTAAVSGVWVLTAVPVGFLLGFLLAKGDLCGASAISEVIVMRDGRKLAGFWVAAVTSMAGFAVLSGLGWMNMYPRPLEWARYLVGGATFGVGMVLAGGCVTGTLYKCGSGHANSLVALIAIPLGVNAVELGPLSGLKSHLVRPVIEGPGGGPVTLSSVTGISYAVLAGVLAGSTLLAGLLLSRRAKAPPPGAVRVAPSGTLAERILTRPWKPWVVGVLIGILSLPGYFSSRASGRDFPLCVTYGVQEVELLLATDSTFGEIWQEGDEERFDASGASGKRIYWWLVAVATSIVPGAWVASRLMGRARLYSRPLGELLAAFVGGLLLGVGAGLGLGCILGNGVTGTALMSVGMMLFAVAAILANWATTYVYVMGGMKPRRPEGGRGR